MAFRISIRLRLLFIVFIVILSLIFQATSISNSQAIVNSIEDKGQKYKTRDSLVITQLDELLLFSENILKIEVEGLIDTLLFLDLRPQNDAIIIEYKNNLSIIINLIKEREIEGYQVYPEAVGFVKNTTLKNLVSKDEFSPFDTIMNTDVVTGAYNILNNLHISWNSSLNNAIAGVNLYRSIFLENAQNYNESAISFITGIGRLGEISNDIRSNLDSTPNQNDTLELRKSLANFNANLTQLFNKWITFENIWYGAVVDLSKDYSLDRTIFEGKISPQITSMKFQLQDINNTLLNQTFNEIFDQNGKLNQMLDDLNSVNFIQVAISKFRTEALPVVVNNIISKIFHVRTLIMDELKEFNILFEELILLIRENQNSQIQTISIIIALFSAIILIPVVFVIRRGLGGLEKKYNQISKGNLNIKPFNKYPNNEIGSIQRAFDDMLFDLREILLTVKQSADELAGISEMLAAGTEEASASINEVSKTISEISSGANDQRTLLQIVSKSLENHQNIIQQTSREIENTSFFVSRVARRTNILGLNASIEAAKAGKFGRGFYVVATQVRELSNDTKSSASDITELIETINQSLRTTIDEVQKEMKIITEVSENTATGGLEANDATSEQVIMLSEISGTTSKLSDLAQSLANIMHRFDLE